MIRFRPQPESTPYLARQRKELSYRLADGSLPPPKEGQFVVTQIGGPPLPEVNVKNSNGLGCAHADEKILKVFSALGLYEASTWTESAELVFWRVNRSAIPRHVHSTKCSNTCPITYRIRSIGCPPP
jgi:hypothetical protein